MVSACRGSSKPAQITIEELGDAFLPRPGDATWIDKQVVVSGGKVERVKPDYVLVIGHTSDGGYQVDLVCYYEKSQAQTMAEAVRGQAVTVSGRVDRTPGGANVLVKLENCEFVLGVAPASGDEAVLASKGRGEVDAERDIKAGKLKLRFRYGRGTANPPQWFTEYQRQLKERCGVETDIRPEAGPIHGLHPDDREYNKVVTAEIEKRFGDGIVEKLKRQAEAST